MSFLKQYLSVFNTKTWLSILLLTLLSQGCATSSGNKNLFVEDREVPVSYWPAEGKTKGVILFSHGAASSPWKYELLTKAWAAEGYDVYAPLHVDSTEHPLNGKIKGLASWQSRLEDMQILSDTYGKDGYIAAGHSYGALTALVKGGVNALIPPGFKLPTEDPRVSLVLAFSPPGAIPGFIEKQGYTSLKAPALIQTGTKDIPFGGTADWTTHLDAYEMAEANGDRYALILQDVDHYFGGAYGRPELKTPKQITELQQAIDVSLLMIERYTHKNKTAQKQLTNLLTDKGQAVFLNK